MERFESIYTFTYTNSDKAYQSPDQKHIPILMLTQFCQKHTSIILMLSQFSIILS
jgi:hypothetical protein